MLAARTTTTSIWCGPLSTPEPDAGAPIDANGNLTSDGSRTFEWDARNQLVAVDIGTHRSEFEYDGWQRAVHVTDRDSGNVQATSRVLWCGPVPCEHRESDGISVSSRTFPQGTQVGISNHFFTRDHLDSATDVSNATGALIARYAFDPWGRRNLITGTDLSHSGFTGHEWRQTAAVSMTQYRVYAPELGRWLSEDPIGFKAGRNFFAYVNNGPTNYRDPSGLLKTSGCSPSQVKQISDAVDSAKSRLNKTSCAGPETRKLIQLIDGAKFVCRPTLGTQAEPLCGQAPTKPAALIVKRIYLGGIAFDSKVCGNLECTIIHEAFHLTQWVGGEASDEAAAYAIENKCCR